MVCFDLKKISEMWIHSVYPICDKHIEIHSLNHLSFRSSRFTFQMAAMAFLLASQPVAFHGVSLVSPSACLFQKALVVAVSEGQGNGGSIGEQQILHPEGVCSNLSLHQTHDSIPSSSYPPPLFHALKWQQGKPAI